jgi:hypothetical protein
MGSGLVVGDAAGVTVSANYRPFSSSARQPEISHSIRAIFPPRSFLMQKSKVLHQRQDRNNPYAQLSATI